MAIQITTHYAIKSRGQSGDWSAEYVGADNRFATESEAEAGIAALRGLGEEWAAAEYRVVAERATIDPEDESYTHELIPGGWESLDDVLSIDAGIAYASERAANSGIASILAPAAKRHIEAMDLGAGVAPHPECYIEEFADGSAFVHSNGGNEVWASVLDYLDSVDCRIEELPDGSLYLASN